MRARVARADSCCGGEVDTLFDDRVEVGRRRRRIVRRIALACSAVLAAAALALSVTGMTGSAVLANRLAWAASVWAAGLMLGWMRQMLTSRPDWRLAVGVAAVVAGIAGQPLVPALVAVALLSEQVVRAPQDETRGDECALQPVAGQLR